MQAFPLYSACTLRPVADAPTGIVFRIKKYAIHDGPGIRTTVFLKGCPLACWWCHNPEGQRLEPQLLKPRDLSGGRSQTLGSETTVAAVIAEVEKDLIFYDESGGGVTFSGGEPLMQAGFLKALIEACAERQMHVALDTCGYAPEAEMAAVIERVNLLLFDLKLMDEKAHLHYTGVSNRLILKNFAAACRAGKSVIVRFPLIPGITDGKDNLRAIAEFAGACGGVRQVDILPFHRIADEKYRRLAMENQMKDVGPPSDDRVQAVKRLFESYAFSVKVGG
jgi:pyruvate formate lyase activating enzyme